MQINFANIKVQFVSDIVLNVFSFIISRCGSGLSGEVLSEHGHQWIGFDISKAMLGTTFLHLKLLFFFRIWKWSNERPLLMTKHLDIGRLYLTRVYTFFLQWKMRLDCKHVVWNYFGFNSIFNGKLELGYLQIWLNSQNITE